jgi:GntR family transcriptional regulator
MTLMWNKPLPESSPLPLWFQIAERLRDAISKGEFTPGDTLPSESQLNAIFGISRSTSRAALDKLEQEGLIVRKSGKGSIVVRPRIDQPANEMLGFSDDMKRRGLKPSYSTLFAGRAKAPMEVAEALGVKVRSSIYQSRRLLKANDAPIGIAVSWLSPTFLQGGGPPSATALNEGSLYEWLQREFGAKVVRASEYIEAAVVDSEMAAELHLTKGAAVLIIRRQSFGEDNLPIEYAVLYYRADRYRLQLESGVVV